MYFLFANVKVLFSGTRHPWGITEEVPRDWPKKKKKKERCILLEFHFRDGMSGSIWHEIDSKSLCQLSL